MSRARINHLEKMIEKLKPLMQEKEVAAAFRKLLEHEHEEGKTDDEIIDENLKNLSRVLNKLE